MAETVNYFAYGSNLQTAQMQQRQIAFRSREFAILPNHRVVFNKKSILYPGFAAANIEEVPRSNIEGVFYELTRDALEELSQYEIGYEIISKKVYLKKEKNSTHTAHIFVAKKSFIIHGLPVSEQYAKRILDGGKGIWSEEYCKMMSLELKKLIT